MLTADPAAPGASASTSTSTATASSPTRSPPGASASPARRASSASSPTGCTPTCPTTRSGGSTGSSSTTGSTSPTRSAPPATRASWSAWERLVASFVLQVPPDHDSSDVTARRILNWIYAWQRLPEARRAPGSSRASASRRATCATNLTPERNHRTLELYALLIAALALPELEPGLLELAVARAARQPADRLRRPTASTASARTHYHMIALRSFVGARENCRRFGVALPRRLRRAAGAAPASSRATAAAPTARSRRSRTATPATTTSCSSSPRGCSRATTCSTRAGRRATRTAATSIQRAGDRYLIFDCGPLGDGGHGHYDALSVEAWAGERALVMDPGRFTYAEGEPNLRHWFRGTAAHNTVTRRRRRPDAVRARALLAAERRGDVPRPRAPATGSTSSRRGPQPRLRGRPPAARGLRRRRLLDDRGRPDRRAAATATTCAGTSPPGRAHDVAGGVTCPTSRSRSSARARSRSRTAGSRPRTASARPRRSSARSRPASARASSRCSRRASPAPRARPRRRRASAATTIVLGERVTRR